jgi:nuclear receptor interaction protein
MKLTLQDRLLQREVTADRRRYSQIRGFYGDSQFIEDLDIVNELEGHSGCINALNWSRSGRLLATGSDDKVVNIYTYQPEFAANQFALATTVETGHRHNIFSVKFMPQSNDRILVTAAGDAEVRIFDIEKATHSTSGARLFLSPSSTNAKVFRSHEQSVKKIVTEASPFYFMTCSEDGTVRQFDIRQPDSTYPGRRSFRRIGPQIPSQGESPPPLISYEEYGIELYTLSCSSSQPHYLALGGTHLHCFLHDRRMIGRDRLKEKGGRVPLALAGEALDNYIADATRCVAKFAPYGQPSMRQADNKQITDCKISDAYPNELIVSWTGENIYNFNILKDQQSHPPTVYETTNGTSADAAREDKKRKRNFSNNSPSNGRNSRPRTSSSDGGATDGHELSLLMQLGNGNSIEVAIPPGRFPPGLASSSRHRNGSEDPGREYGQQIRALRNALGRTHHSHGPAEHVEEMIQILLAASTAKGKIDEYISHRAYPVTSAPPLVDYELKLRADRAKVWRYAQAAGTLARVLLKYRRQPVNEQEVQEVDLNQFDMVRPASRESSSPLERHEQFGYDFIKAILLWLDSGVGAVLREFSGDGDPSARTTSKRFPVSKDAGVDAVDHELIPYLERLATEMPIVYGGGQGGLGDDPRHVDTIFASERAAVRTLGEAMKIPFADLTEDELSTSKNTRQSSTRGAANPLTPYRDSAMKFWGHKVCVAVLQSAAIDVNFAFASTAFGEPLGNEPTRELPNRPSRAFVPVTTAEQELQEVIEENAVEALEDTDRAEELLLAMNGREEEDEDEDEDEDEEDEYDLYDDDEEEDEDEEEDQAGYAIPNHDNSSEDDGYGRKSKYTAGKNVPCSSHAREYRGHCNVNTTKDLNFYGLQDEYVVSGSDCGNVFIWERKTSKLVNILEGDREVVNVIQRKQVLSFSTSRQVMIRYSAHPYEPMLAVSGIDSTIKIFSPDAHARRNALRGVGVSAADHSAFSSIGLSHRRRGVTARGGSNDSNGSSSYADQNGGAEEAESAQDSDNERVAPNGLASRKRIHLEYEITSENDMERRTENHSDYISRGMIQLLAQRIGNPEEMEENCRMM